MWREEDVISFIEQKLIDDAATDAEYGFYLDYLKKGYVDKKKHRNIYKYMLREMKRIYEGRC